MKKLFTSESVSAGHPDKLADQISDAVLDYILANDENAKVACEVFITTDFVLIGGQVATKLKDVNYEKIARDILIKAGYDDDQLGIDGNHCAVMVKVEEQSPDIALGLNLANNQIGAGDQGIMFGYATNESKTFLPLPITMAHELVYLATKLRKSGEFKHARPDMKSQVTIDYTNPEKPLIDTILMSIQHDDKIDLLQFKKYIVDNIMKVVAKEFNLNTDFKVLINPTGRFVIGGPKSDVGLTGRKIIVDTYGGAARHGGGAFSGKDATKVDRTAAYMARYAAKNMVAAGLADRLEIQLSYAIGEPNPVSVYLEAFGTNKVSGEVLEQALLETFDFSVAKMIETLDLRKPVFLKTATYGHFGKEEFRWEQLDKVDQLKKYLN